MGAAVTHDFDPATSFCRRCGCARVQAVESGAGCVEGENVVGVSHVIAGRRMAQEFRLNDLLRRLALRIPGPGEGPEAA